MQVDKVSNPESIKLEAEKRDDVICVSALSGEGINEFCSAVQEKLKVRVLVSLFPFDNQEWSLYIYKVKAIFCLTGLHGMGGSLDPVRERGAPQYHT